MRRSGGFLIVVGVLGLALGGITISRPRAIARVGPVQLTVQEDRARLIPFWMSGVVLLAGFGLVTADRRRTAASRRRAEALRPSGEPLPLHAPQMPPRIHDEQRAAQVIDHTPGRPRG